VATLRSRYSRLSLVLALVATAPGLRAAETSPSPTPAALQLPGWIESIGERSGRPASTTRGPRDAAALVRPVADWTEPPNTATATGAAATTPAGGAEPSGFRRWLSERVSSLPSPVALLGGAKPEPGDDATKDAANADGPAPLTAPVAVTPDEMPALAVDPASFRGVHPGRTTAAQLQDAWGTGEAFTRDDGSTAFWWRIDPFDRVEVTVQDDMVQAIAIRLTEPLPVEDLAKQLEIGELRTVAIRDEQDAVIGRVYPERGVILSLKPGTTQASAILIEPLDADNFVLRAENEIDTCSANASADLTYALTIDPGHVRAHRLLLAMASEQGRWSTALRLATEAEKLDPTDAWTRLKRAGVLLALDRPDEARAALDSVAIADQASPLVVAQRARLLGRVALAGRNPDYKAAVEHFAEAIRRASAAQGKRSPVVQAAAAEVLLDAHLGTALAIARGTWQQKGRVIPKWIARSEALVTDYPGDEAERQVLELQLCRGALAAAAGCGEAIDPLPWVKRLLEAHDRVGQTVTDPWRRRQTDWEVGQALAEAITAAQRRGEAADMLDNATLTAAYLERGAQRRELTDGERKQLGELMFRIGIMHSLQRGDHATAVTWFDRVVPYWDDNARFVADGETGRLGESYVSMAISYWQVSRRDDAVQLSKRGVELMVAAVDSNQLEERALAVAYGNLSTMYAEQGDADQSRSYAEMASRAEAAGTTLR